MSRRRKPYFPTRPPEPKQLVEVFREIFPDFGDAEVLRDVDAATEQGSGLHHAVRCFIDHWGGQQLSDRQLESLGRIVNEAVAEDDALENAVSTVFLEHLHQMKRDRQLAPFLSRRAKEKTRA